MSMLKTVNNFKELEYINQIKSNPIIAVKDDISQIKEIGYYFWKESGVYSDDFYLNVLRQNLSLVYKNNQLIIAVCLAYYDKKRDVDIALLCVRKDYQRKGFGESILRQCIDRCVNLGYNTFYLHVEVNNKPAYKLYKKIGFEKVMTVINYYASEILPENRNAYKMYLFIGKKTEEKKDTNINIIHQNQPIINYNNYNKQEYIGINKNYIPDFNINNDIYRKGHINNNNNCKINNYFKYDNFNNNYLNNIQNYKNYNNINNRIYKLNFPNKNSNNYINYINASKNINTNTNNNANNNYLNNRFNTIKDYVKDYWNRINHKFHG